MKQFGVKLFIVKIADCQKIHYFPNSFEKKCPKLKKKIVHVKNEGILENTSTRKLERREMPLTILFPQVPF